VTLASTTQRRQSPGWSRAIAAPQIEDRHDGPSSDGTMSVSAAGSARAHSGVTTRVRS